MRLCVLVLIAACSSDPTLSVTVTHPEGIVVTKTTVTVYESTTVHCTDIEFARLDAAGLSGITTSEADIEAGTAKLDGISRLGTKIIVARGYDSSGLVSAGCVEHGEVIGNDSAAIATVAAATVSVHAGANSEVSNEIQVVLTDQTSSAIADARPVSWTVYGAAGAMPANPGNTTSPADGVWEPSLPTCAMNGQVAVHPNPPSTLGGFAVQMRVAWEVEPPPVYTSLAAPAFSVLDLGITPTTTAKQRPCAIRGTQLICVDAADQAHLYNITVANAVASIAPAGTMAAAPVGQNVVAVLGIPNTTGANDVYAVVTNGVLVFLFGAPPPDNTTPVCLTKCDDAIYLPACGGASAKVLIGNGSKIHQIDAHGGNANAFDISALGSKFDTAGCVTVLQSDGSTSLGQFAVIQTTTASIVTDEVLVNCTTSPCKGATAPLTRGAGVGFTGGSEPRFVATTVDASGVVLAEDVFTAGGQAIERARLAAASVPEHIVAGQFDTDTDVDLFWDIAVRAGQTNFELGYARKIGNDNLEALSTTASITVEEILVDDVDNDGHDDVVVVADTGVVIVPFGVTLPAQTLPVDATCSP